MESGQLRVSGPGLSPFHFYDIFSRVFFELLQAIRRAEIVDSALMLVDYLILWAVHDTV